MAGLSGFFVARLRTEGPKRKAELFLRYKASSGEDMTGNESVLTSFCFPLGPEYVQAKEFLASEEYMFTLTHGDGRRFQGFCRGFLPDPPKVGPKARFPLVMCLVTEHPWCNFFNKVLQVLEHLAKSGDCLLGSDLKELPSNSHTAAFLRDLEAQLAAKPAPGDVIRVPFPRTVSMLGVSPPRFLGQTSDTLAWGEDHLELQVPPDCSNGRWNCGIPLARLLWHVPVSAMLTLIASMLLERRIVLVSQARDTVTAAVQAAAALLYPFKWHHIFLPMLPKTFKDYLTAPMPFLVGMPAQMLPLLKGIPMDEVTLIDLDLGKCDPPPGSARDDARLLPFREQLEAALKAVHANIRSPTEYETSPLIAGIMQEFYCKLFGSYHRFLHEDTPALNRQWAGLLSAHTALLSSAAPGAHGSNTSSPGHRAHTASGSGAAAVGPATLGGGSARERGREGGEAGQAARVSALQEESLRGRGHVFEQVAFVASHRKNDKVRAFLAAFRHSQMYEMFMQERFARAADDDAEPDPFEDRITRYQERRQQRLQSARVRASQPSASMWAGLKKRHQRTNSEEALKNGAGMGSLMRRITTDPNSKLGGASAQALDLSVDPASFFEDEGEDLGSEEFMTLQDPAMRNLASFSGHLVPGSASADGLSPTGTAAPRGLASLTSLTSQARPTSANQLQHQASSSSDVSPSTLQGAGTEDVADSLGDAARARLVNGHVGRSSAGVGAAEAWAGSNRSLATTSASASTVYGAGAPAPPGVTVSVAADGHKVYEGSLGSIMKGAWADMRNSMLRTHSPQQSTGSAPSPPGATSGQQGSGAASSSAGTGLKDAAGKLFDSLLASAAGPSAAAPQSSGPAGGSLGYRAQVTGDGRARGQGLMAKYLPQGTGGGLLSHSGDGRPGLKQPPAPARPLAVSSLSPRSAQGVASPLHDSPAATAGALEPRAAAVASAAAATPRAVAEAGAVGGARGGSAVDTSATAVALAAPAVPTAMLIDASDWGDTFVGATPASDSFTSAPAAGVHGTQTQLSLLDL